MEAILFTSDNRELMMYHPDVNSEYGWLIDKAFTEGYGREREPVQNQFYFIPQYEEERVKNRRNWALLPVDFVRLSYRFDEEKAKTEFVPLIKR